MKTDKKKPKESKEPKDAKEPKPGQKPGDQYAYSAGEDIYSKEDEAEDIDPETGEAKTTNVPADEMNEKDFRQDKSGDDLDVPEDDDEPESVEDEENDHYSLGGDDHEDLDEDKGDAAQ